MGFKMLTKTLVYGVETIKLSVFSYFVFSVPFKCHFVQFRFVKITSSVNTAWPNIQNIKFCFCQNLNFSNCIKSEKY